MSERIFPTHAQKDYILILANDCGFTINSRNVWLSNEFKRSINDIDELHRWEASLAIGRLKEIRQGLNDKNSHTRPR